MIGTILITLFAGAVLVSTTAVLAACVMSGRSSAPDWAEVGSQDDPRRQQLRVNISRAETKLALGGAYDQMQDELTRDLEECRFRRAAEAASLTKLRRQLAESVG